MMLYVRVICAQTANFLHSKRNAYHFNEVVPVVKILGISHLDGGLRSPNASVSLFIYLFIHSFIHSFIRPSIHPSIRSFIHCQRHTDNVSVVWCVSKLCVKNLKTIGCVVVGRKIWTVYLSICRCSTRNNQSTGWWSVSACRWGSGSRCS